MSDTTLLTSIVETTEAGSTPGITVTRFMASGETHARAIVDAVINAYPRPDDITERLARLDGVPVTILRSGETMMGASLVTASSVKLFKEGTAYLPKGARSKGFRLNPDNVLDVVPGYSGEKVLAAKLADVRARFPQLVSLTRDRLASLPSDGDVCSLGIFGRRSIFGTCHDAVYLVHSYDPENDIAEGVLFIRPENGCSESGSEYGERLLDMGGEIVGLPTITFAEAVAMTEWDHDQVLELVRGAA